MAHNHHIKVFSFCKILLKNREMWARDIDKSISLELVERIAVGTGLSKEKVLGTTLKYFEARLFDKLTINGTNSWILPLGIYHRKRKSNGLQLCTSCLKKDPIIYYRKLWRIAGITGCIKCKRKLIDRCPKCLAPIVFHRQDVGEKNNFDDIPICNCSNCGYDFRSYLSVELSPIDLNNQKKFRRIIKSKSYGSFNNIDFLIVLRTVIRNLLSKHTRAKGFQQKVRNRYKEYNSVSSIKGGFINSFERISLNDRNIVLNTAFWVLNNWPNRFVKLNKESGTTSYIWLTNNKYNPVWFDKVVKEHLYLKY